MKPNTFAFLSLSLAIILIAKIGNSQEQISWLSDHTAEINAGSYTYVYNFTTLENDCKIKIEEKKISSKGSETKQSSIFYLSDISPSSLNFKSTGKVLAVSMQTKQSQKFISSYEGEEFKSYTNEVTIYTSEVDKARDLIDAFLSHIETCKDNERTWTSKEEVVKWLTENIGDSEKSGTNYKQSFRKDEKPHLALLKTESTDSKGQQETNLYSVNLSDINPDEIKLEVSGKSLKINLPVKNKMNFVKLITNDSEISYQREFEIHVDDIELARDEMSALKYLVSNTEVNRTEYSDYFSAMSYVKENIMDASVGSNKYEQSLTFENSPSGQINYKSIKTDSKAVSKESIFQFYPSDISPEVKLNVSSSVANIEISSIGNDKFIKQTLDGNLMSYTNNVEIFIDDIDAARDIINALEYSLKNSESGVQKFESVNAVSEWLNSNMEEVIIDGESTQQNIVVSSTEENKVEIKKITSSEGSDADSETFEVYPQDFSMEDIVIKISGKKLSIPLSTGKLKYIKSYKEGILQNYASKIEIQFNDVKTAKNFIAAISFLYENTKNEDRSFSDENSAYDFISKNLILLELGGNTLDQKIEKMDENTCKLKYILKETESKGTTEYIYEFMIQDIDAQNSNISVTGKELKINLVTKGKQKLIKPYKGGEPGNFIYNFDLYTDDVVTAKKILAAFQTINEKCK